jgi:arsenate reductase
MAEALFHRLAGGRHAARSAGTAPAEQVHAVVTELMPELAGRKPQPLTDQLAAWAGVVVTMGCGDACPFIPGKRYLDWDLPDPAGRSREEVEAIRDEIERRVEELVLELDQTGGRHVSATAPAPPKPH